VLELGAIFICTLYHPSRLSYTSQSLLQHIEVCVEEINRDFVECRIVLAGDLNQLSDKEIVIRRADRSDVDCPPTNAILDRICVSSHEYSTVRMVASTVRSDHSAVVAYCRADQCTVSKTRQQRIYRPITPISMLSFLTTSQA